MTRRPIRTSPGRASDLRAANTVTQVEAMPDRAGLALRLGTWNARRRAAWAPYCIGDIAVVDDAIRALWADGSSAELLRQRNPWTGEAWDVVLVHAPGQPSVAAYWIPLLETP